MVAHIFKDIPGTSTFTTKLILQIWEQVGDEIRIVEKPFDEGDSKLNISHKAPRQTITTHKVTTIGEVTGSRKCGGRNGELRTTQIICQTCGHITFNVKADGTAHLQCYNMESLLAQMMMMMTMMMMVLMMTVMMMMMMMMM
eukprot:9220614-Karenia_brevis.AAC.1